jgi:hypothetical protein
MNVSNDALARQARELANSGQHESHETILAHLSGQEGFAAVLCWASDPLVRTQIDQLCREARKSRLATVHRLSVSDH